MTKPGELTVTITAVHTKGDREKLEEALGRFRDRIANLGYVITNVDVQHSEPGPIGKA